MPLANDAPTQCHPNVNRPVCLREDVKFLREELLDCKRDRVLSDHGCCYDKLETERRERRADRMSYLQ